MDNNYLVFVWRRDGCYHLAEPLKRFATYAAAAKYVNTYNAARAAYKMPSYVVRVLCLIPPYEYSLVQTG